MLVLSRRVGESLKIGDNITVTITEVRGGIVKVAITAPKSVPIVRDDAKVREPQHEATR